MRSLKLSIISLGLFAGISTTAAAQQVTIEGTGGFLTGSYVGFNWANAYVENPFIGYGSLPTGMRTVVSGTNVLLNGGGQALSISSASQFNLNSGTFGAAWTNGLTMNVKGYNGGALLYDKNFSLNWNVAQNLSLNLHGVDNVVFSSFGGTVDPSFAWDSNQSFVADNLNFGENDYRVLVDEGDFGVSVSVVPEPMTVSLMAAGLLVLGSVQSRRRRMAQAK